MGRSYDLPIYFFIKICYNIYRKIKRGVFNAVRFEEGDIIKPSSLHLHSIPDKIVPKTNIFEHKDFVFDTNKNLLLRCAT